MKKKVLMVSLSIVMVLGLAGIVNATTISNNTPDMQTKALNVQDYMANDNVASMQGEQIETTQPDQTVPSKTDGYNQMGSSNMSSNGQMQNMPINTQMQNMPMNTQMSNPEHIQGMAGMNNPSDTSVIQQPTQKSSSENRMGSMGRMGR